ncbi:AI-2E family transporter [Raineyella sp.]|uniref:Transport protein YhhT n=1 Tax=bioreactor metagenome TaxID=1076179 RepID=A0A644Y923_9ZZZZ|nr:AI-2E family transporter [Raineyella sp.]MEA5153244.1 AI-2E family transporter [Raineyella sp.]
MTEPTPYDPGPYDHAPYDPGRPAGPRRARGTGLVRDDTPLPMGVSLIIIAAALVVVAVGLRYTAGIIAPTFFALTLVLTVGPMRQRLVRRHLPGWLASLLMLLLLYAIIFGILAGFAVSIVQLVAVLPRYAGTVNEMSTQVLAWLAERGLDTSNATLLLGQIDLGRIITVLQGLLAGVSSAGTIIFVLAMAVAFLLVDSTEMEGRLASLRQYQPYLAAALGDFGYRVRRYWVVNTLFGLIVAALDTVVLFALGVPLPLVWGLFAWVTNYIPNIGFVIGLVPPALLALLDGGPVEALIVVIAYSVLNFVIQAVIQPKFTGDAVGLNTTVTFVSLVFWTVVIGALGSILAVPLTLFAKSLLIDSSPRLTWVNVFLRSKDAEEPPIRPHWPPVHVPSLPRWLPWSAQTGPRRPERGRLGPEDADPRERGQGGVEK